MDKWLIENIGWVAGAMVLLLVGVKFAAGYWLRRLSVRADSN